MNAGRWIAAPVLAALLALARPPAESPVRASFIDTDEPVAATLFGDADGDGLKDAALLIGRRVALYKQRKDRTFPTAPDREIKLPADAVAVDFTPFDRPGRTRALPRADLLILCGRGLFAWDLGATDSEPRPIELPAVPRPLAPLAVGAPPISMSMLADLDGDGLPELILPTAKGAAVLRQNDAGWTLLGVAEAEIGASVKTGDDRPGGSLEHEINLPRIATAEAYRDGKRELYLCVSHASQAHVFRIEGDRLRRVQRVEAHFRLDDEDRLRRVRGTRQNDEVNDRAVGLQACDLNGDGLLDFVSSRFRDGEVYIIFGREGDFSAEAPDVTINADGWVAPIQPKDLNGDKRPDLIVPRIPKIGITSALRALLSRRVSFDLWIYRNSGGAAFAADKPEWKRTFDVELMLGGAEGRISVSAHLLVLFGDVTGDGVCDLVTRLKDDALAVYPGDREHVAADDPIAEVPIPKVSEWSEVDMRGNDLDGDGREDIILTYGANTRGARNRIAIFIWKPK